MRLYPAEIVGDQQEDDDAKRYGNANGQCCRRTFLLALVVHQVIERKAQRHDDRDQGDDDNDFGKHGVKFTLGNWQPRWWVTLLVVFGGLACARLSLWQYERGQAKAEIEQGRLQASLREPQVANFSSGKPVPYGDRVRLDGHWLPDSTILLDNQTRKGVPGVHVWTPFQTSSGAVVLVNRGWTSVSGDRSEDLDLAPVEALFPRGILRDLPRSGIAVENGCEAQGTPRLTYPTLDQLQCFLGPDLLPVVLLMDADLPGAYVREWQRFEMPPEKHYAYAFQWAALGLAILIIYFRLNRTPATGQDDD